MKSFIVIFPLLLIGLSGIARADEYYDDEYYYDDVASGGKTEDKASTPLRRQGHGGGYGGGGGKDSLGLAAPLVLLAPLAGLASLFAAAAINTNSGLVTLGTLGGRRRKRDVEQGVSTRAEELDQEVQVFQNFFMKHKEVDIEDENELLASKYVQCSGLFESGCMEYSACHAALATTDFKPEDSAAVNLIVSRIMKNKYIENWQRKKIRYAVDFAETYGHCRIFKCDQITY